MEGPQGWVSIYRKLQNHWLWKSNKPFDKRSAWIDIVLMVNHKPGKVFFNNEIVEVDTGERITSEVKLAKRWGWSRTKVRNFLELLEQDEMIDNIKENKKRTRLRVRNYSKYQSPDTCEKTSKKQEENNRKTSKKQDSNTNNNDNNDINENNDNNIPYAEIINYLNQRANRNFKSTSQATQRHISARWNEGFGLEDFKEVIDKKCTEWLNDNEMSKYLRPRTLFGTKFEGYLNQPEVGNNEKQHQRNDSSKKEDDGLGEELDEMFEKEFD